MGRLAGERCNCQASAICGMVASCRPAMAPRISATCGSPLSVTVTGCQGENTAPAFSAASSRLELVQRDIGQADVGDQPLIAQPGEGCDLVLERRVRGPAAVQVVQADLLDSEPAGAHLRALPKVVLVAH